MNTPYTLWKEGGEMGASSGLANWSAEWPRRGRIQLAQLAKALLRLTNGGPHVFFLFFFLGGGRGFRV